jgi:inner membrane protein
VYDCTGDACCNMHIPTHIMSGWCVASLFDLTPRERLCCMAAASLEDLDGMGILVGGPNGDAFQHYHHLLGHNLLFVTIVALGLAAISTHKFKGFLLYLALGHLHILLDYFGSGPGWGIAYFWPFERHSYKTDLAWEFFSWQNLTAAGVLLVGTIVIAIRQRRTPVELIAPDLDRRFVKALRREHA